MLSLMKEQRTAELSKMVSPTEFHGLTLRKQTRPATRQDSCLLQENLRLKPWALGKHTGEFWNDVRQYCREAMVSRDGLLEVKAEPDVMSGNLNRERIVIPKPLVPALLYHIHNHNEQHPIRSQQKASFTRQFYAIQLRTSRMVSERSSLQTNPH